MWWIACLPRGLPIACKVEGYQQSNLLLTESFACQLPDARKVQLYCQRSDDRSGNFVIVRASQEVTRAEKDNWWMGQVHCCEGGATDPNINSLFQVADIDDGAVRWVNADGVIHVLHSIDGLFD